MPNAQFVGFVIIFSVKRYNHHPHLRDKMNARRNALKMFGTVSLIAVLEGKSLFTVGDTPPIL